MLKIYQRQLLSLTKRVSYSLTQQEAKQRSLLINSHIQNDVNIELLASGYRALVKTEFSMTKQQDLFLDFDGQVDVLTVNGKQVESIQKNQKLWLKGDWLQQNNSIEMLFSKNYSNNGHGLHSFGEQESQYVYSQCEPKHAYKIFPCFDQPDLKGKFRLLAYAPKDWRVISNEKEVTIDMNYIRYLRSKGLFNEDPSFLYHQFENTLPMSTYLYAILAGPYVEIKAPQSQLHNGVPQSLYCRKSLQKFVEKDAEEIFTMTSKGMEFYENLFGYKYPFSKYDQIFCPEYSTGAMENAGAVTINDLYVFKEEVTTAQRASRANTILHELSHMWFGDLVTMKWWDDLWLNESFAEFVAHLCQDEIQSPAWIQFMERKQWGYITDEKSTTHPIYSDIHNTDQAENIFDGITYAKGAALLKQMFFMIGKDRFRAAMTKYFHKHQFANTTLADFFEVMAAEGNVDWNSFKEDWIMKEGFNTISYDISGNIVKFRQSGKHLREHQFTVAYWNQGKLQLESIKLQRSIETSITLKYHPDVIILNYNDESYVKAHYSHEQTQLLLQKLPLISSLNRLVVLQAIWDQIRDGHTCFRDFIQSISAFMKLETDDTVIKILLQWCSAGINAYTPKGLRHEMRETLLPVLEDLLLQQNNSNSKTLLLKSYIIAWSKTPERINKLLEREHGIKDQWALLYHAFNYAPRWDLYEKQAKRDSDFAKHKRYLEALSIQKAEIWSYFINFTGQESNHQVVQAMRAFNQEDVDLTEFEGQFFNQLPQIFSTKDSEYAKAFYNYLFPLGDNLSKYINLCEEVLSQTKNDFLTKLLKESIDVLIRRQKTYSKYI